jgi:NAD kinase
VSTKITIRKVQNGRGSAWVSLDGATRFELKEGEEIQIQATDNTISFVVDPTENLTEAWSRRLTEELGWNARRIEMKKL